MADNTYSINVATEADSTSVEELANKLQEVTNSAQEAGAAVTEIEGSGIEEAGSAAEEASNSITETGNAASETADKVEEIGTAAEETGSITAEQMAAATLAIGGMTAGLELGAESINDTNIKIGQLATQTGIAEPVLRDMVAHISNATFPVSEATAYIERLSQFGVAGDNLAKSATSLDRINDAFGLGSNNVLRLSNSLNVMGIDMANIESSYNALAYAQANVAGGTQAYIGWMEKYDSQFKEMGLNIDQTAVLIGAATKRFGGGRAAYSGLNDAIKNSNGNLEELERQLGMQPGSLQNASQATADYAGNLEEAAGQEAEHKTALQEAKAYLEDIGVQYGDVMGVMGSFGGILGSLTGIVTAAYTAKLALAGATAAETTAENVSFISKVKSAGASVIHTAAEAGRTAILLGTAAAQWALNIAMSANPIGIIIIAIIALIAVLGYLYYNNETVRNGINWLWDSLKGLGEYIAGGLVAAWGIMISPIQSVVDALKMIYCIIVGCSPGIIPALMMLPGAFITTLGAIPSIVLGFVISVVSALAQVIIRVVMFGISFHLKIIHIFLGVVNKARAYISQLPGIVWNEMINIGKKIASAAGYIFGQVQAVFGNIVNWAMKALGIASPGHIARAVFGEMDYLVAGITDAQGYANLAAAGLGDAILEGFGSPSLSVGGSLEYDTASLGFDATELNNSLTVNSEDPTRQKITQNNYITQEGIMGPKQAAEFIVKSVIEKLEEENMITGKTG
ncbi:MAG: hypothetical protein Q8M06_11865 [Methanobacteriaceae archaeon]|nr:hypothetical protein [Methanobacteriaceae archaeon]